MRKAQSGFTLIELVVVIVILGILAATALPRFIDMSGDAKQAKAHAFAGAIGSYAAQKYAQSIAQGTHTSYSGATSCSAANVDQSVQSGANCTASYSNSACTVTCDSYSATAKVDFT